MPLTDEQKRKRPVIAQPTYAQRLGVNTRNIRDEAAGLITGFNNVMNQAVANDAAAKQRIRGEVVQSFNAGTPTAAPAPAIKPAVPAPAPIVKQPVANPAVMTLAPGSMSGQPGFPADPVSAKPGRPSAPAAPAAGSPEEVIGTFNGRAITRAESDRLSGNLPAASGPVVMGPNGSYAAATGGSAQPASAAALSMPTYGDQGQGAVISDPTKGTEAERAKLMSNLSSQINELQMGGANMRSKRDLLSTLIGMQAKMNEAKAGNEVTLAGQQNAANIAAMNETGQNRRFDIGEAGQNRRFDLQDATTRQLGAAREMGDTYRTLLGLQPKAEYVTDANGNTVRVDGTQYTAVTGADGAPLRTQQKDSGLTAKDLLADITAREKNLSDLRAMGDTPELQAQAQQLAQERAAVMAGGTRNAPDVGAVKGGYRFKGGDPADKNNWEKVQ